MIMKYELKIKADKIKTEFYHDNKLILKMSTAFLEHMLRQVEKKDKYESTFDVIKRKN